MAMNTVCFSGNLKMVDDGLGPEEEDFLSDAEVDFHPDFREYMEMELEYSRLESSDKLGLRWVFWNRRDDDPFLTRADDHDSVDSIQDICANRKVRLNIRHALHKLVLHPQLNYSLVQFWAPTKTLEGRTLLTIQFQPFALGKSYYKPFREVLCEYRMGMCRKYNFFYADADSGEEQLGLPGRVFLHQFPESAPDVKYYTLKEYPQRDLSLRCGIMESWAMPVFEHSNHTCVGVVELVCLSGYDAFEYWYDEEFLGHMCDIFQEFGLKCFDGYKHCKMQYGDTNEALTAAYWELKMVYESVCKIHNLPLALTWVSCHSCNDLLQSQFQFSVPYCCGEDNCDPWSLRDFMEVSKVCHLRKEQVTGRILPFPNLIYCSDVKQFSIDEFQLVAFARHCRLGGCFTMCLKSSYTGDELYVLEFFLPASNEYDENILARLRLRLILDTMEECFKTFKLASGQEWGEVISVEVIDFQNFQKSHSIQMIPSARFIPSLGLLKDGGVMLQLGQLAQPSVDYINTGKHNLPSLDSLQDGKVIVQLVSSDEASTDLSNNSEDQEQILKLNSSLISDQASAIVAYINPGFQDATMVPIKAKYGNYTIKFKLSSSPRLVKLQQEVAKRLNLEAGTYDIRYKDEENELILIACDDDLQDCIDNSRSLGNTSIVLLLEPKQPMPT